MKGTLPRFKWQKAVLKHIKEMEKEDEKCKVNKIRRRL